MADSASLVGASPVAAIAACWVSFQLSLITVVNPAGPCSSITGSASTSVSPLWIKEGPIPRTITCLEALPVMMKPPMPTLSPTETRMRVERLTACVINPGVAVGVAVGIAVGVGVGPPGVAVAVAVAVGVGPTGVAVAVAVALAVAVGVGVAGQLPFTLNTMCMFGNPIAAVSVGVVIPHVVALR